VPKKTADPAEAVASGPFALGPAKRAVKSSRSGESSGSAVKIEKLESSVVHGGLSMVSESDSDEELDIDFDASDPNAPCNICRSDIDDDQMKIQDPNDDLVLFQIPDILNSLITSSSNQSDTVMVKDEDGNQRSENKIGRIGTLFIDQNGKMELKIAHWSFDLNRTLNSHSFQKLVLVEGNNATDLGKVSQRVICTPQIESNQ
jgi:hypothetical protein